MDNPELSKLTQDCKAAWASTEEILPDPVSGLPSHSAWSTAQKKNLPLPPHPPLLRPWRPDTADWSDPAPQKPLQGFDANTALIMDAGLSPAEEQALWHAIQSAPGPGFVLHLPDHALEGYEWYDDIPRIASVKPCIHMEDKIQDLPEDVPPLVPQDSLLLELKERPREDPEDEAVHHHLQADFVFLPDKADAPRAPVVDPAAKITPQELARIMQASFHDPQDRSESDEEAEEIHLKEAFGDRMLAMAADALEVKPHEAACLAAERICRRELAETLDAGFVARIEIIPRILSDDPMVVVPRPGEEASR